MKMNIGMNVKSIETKAFDTTQKISLSHQSNKDF